MLFATEKFRQDNPKTYRAFVEALKEAAAFAQNDKAAAADTYIRVTGAKIDRAALLKIIANPQVEFSVTPKNTYPLAEFLPGRCDPQQAGLLAGLFLPGRRAVAGELRRR